MAAKKNRILLACAPEAYIRLFAILSGYELTFARTLTDAHAALKGGNFGLIMIGVYFDDSRMFELLSQVRSDGKYAEVPIVCFRGVLAAGKGTSATKDVEMSCKALGANAFLDLTAFPDDGYGNGAVRDSIKSLLS
jgi:hypothetical protein